MSIVPRLDDTDFETLTTEALSLIPRFAPEWTDHNLHDPGITLIDLLAFHADRQIYRTGHVGPSLRRAFARLLGIDTRPAAPARFEIWPDPELAPMPLHVADHTPLASPDLPGAPFMTDGAFRLVQSRIAGLWLDRDDTRTPIGTGLVRGHGWLTLLPARQGGPRLLELELDQPPADGADAPPATLGVAVRTDTGDGSPWDDIAVEQRRATGTWREIEVEDGTRGLSRSGVIRFRPMPDGAPRLRLRLDHGLRPGRVTLERIGLNVIPAREGWREADGLVGIGTGLPDAVFAFPTADIVTDETPLTLRSSWPDGERDWTPVADFTGSGPADRHVVVDPDAGTVRLGNGLNGAVLAADAQLRHGPLNRTRGAGGNVRRGLRWTLAGIPVGENLRAGRGGRDRDGLADLVLRALEASKARAGCLTAEGVRDRAAEAGLGLVGITVLAGRRPGAAAPGSRTVIALPDRDPADPPQDPDPALSEALARALAPVRLLGERLHVSAPMYMPVDVSVRLSLRPAADRAGLAAEAERLIRARLWDVAAPEPDVAPWPPGRPLGAGDIRGLLTRLSDVVAIEHCAVTAADGRAPDESGLLRLRDQEIALAREVRIETENAR